MSSDSAFKPGETPASRVWRDALTVPNALSLARAALGVAFPFAPEAWRLPMVVAAAVSDMLDGAAGRWFGWCSDSGRVLDPVADKIFAVFVAATMLWEGTVTPIEALAIGVRDLVVLAGTVAGACLRRWSDFREMKPTLLGKATTAAQFAFFAAAIALPDARPTAFFVAALLSLAAGVQYGRLFASTSR